MGPLMLAVMVAAACGDQVPSIAPSAPIGPIVSSACVGLDAVRCELLQTAVLDQLPGGAAPQYIVASERLCDGPCPGAAEGIWLGHVFVELLDGREPAIFLTEAGPNGIDWEPVPTALFRAIPDSPRLNALSTRFTLGHCGLESGVDVDSSFWDPLGALNREHPDAINAAESTFTLSSPVTARLVTDGGLVVDLHRHTGPKYLPGCM